MSERHQPDRRIPTPAALRSWPLPVPGTATRRRAAPRARPLGPETDKGSVPGDAVDFLTDLLGSAPAVLIGPGLFGVLARELLDEAPLVLAELQP